MKVLGFMLVREDEDNGLVADWDETVHPSRDDADAELEHANGIVEARGGVPWRLVAVVELDEVP